MAFPFSLVIALIPLGYVVGVIAKRKRDISEKWEGHPDIVRISGANGFGMTSRGRGQIRGNGILVLTRDQVVFEQIIPATTTQIPLQVISDISVVHSHLGRTRGVPLLKITFLNEDGIEDSGAWWVKDLEVWKEDLARAISH
ncbi:hypothetical protein H8D30_00220 [bacterium]|nr:hypothetical protein [bacterium]